MSGMSALCQKQTHALQQKWSCYSIALSAVASSVVISVIFGALAHVRYYPNSDRTADIAQCRKGAKFERRLRATASFTLDALLGDRAAGQ